MLRYAVINNHGEIPNTAGTSNGNVLGEQQQGDTSIPNDQPQEKRGVGFWGTRSLSPILCRLKLSYCADALARVGICNATDVVSKGEDGLLELGLELGSVARLVAECKAFMPQMESWDHVSMQEGLLQHWASQSFW